MREQLLDWRPLHPIATAEAPSAQLKDFIYKSSMPDGAEYYENDIYQVTVRAHEKHPLTDGPCIQLGISSEDGTARHDFRDFQDIKNRFAGSEWEAVELYPAESRLLDPSNYYILWCFPVRLRVGKNEGRRVIESSRSIAPQRRFPNER